MRFDSDEIDECSEQLKGHTNWAYAEMVEPKILKRELKAGNVIIFFDDEANEDGEYE